MDIFHSTHKPGCRPQKWPTPWKPVDRPDQAVEPHALVPAGSSQFVFLVLPSSLGPFTQTLAALCPLSQLARRRRSPSEKGRGEGPRPGYTWQRSEMRLCGLRGLSAPSSSSSLLGQAKAVTGRTDGTRSVVLHAGFCMSALQGSVPKHKRGED